MKNMNKNNNSIKLFRNINYQLNYLGIKEFISKRLIFFVGYIYKWLNELNDAIKDALGDALADVDVDALGDAVANANKPIVGLKNQ